MQAIRGVSLAVGGGEIRSVLGANGAGKSSLLRAISGLVRPRSGEIELDGRRLTGAPAHRIVRAGIAHVPEGRRVSAPLSVEDNLLLAAGAAHRRSAKDTGSFLAQMYELFPRLGERRSQTSGLLSGGEQQMLAIARALMSRPEVLLLDEPSMGLAPIVVAEIYDLLRQRPAYLAEMAILLAEQSTSLALSVADSATVLVRGEVVYNGPAAELSNEFVRAAYLGNASIGASLVAGTRGTEGIESTDGIVTTEVERS
jgi:branched-chain amino acid transport system ATP-binding protein